MEQFGEYQAGLRTAGSANRSVPEHWMEANKDRNRQRAQDDVVAYHPSNGTLWIGKNTGSSFAFTIAGAVPAGMPNYAFTPGFFSGDGHFELIAYDPNTGALLHARNAASNFSVNAKPVATLAPAAGWSFVAGQFTGGGTDDLMGYSPSNGTLWVGRNTGLRPEGYAWPLFRKLR